MSQRLEQLREQALESGGQSARGAVEGASGFDEAIRKRLEMKIASASLQFEHPIEPPRVGMPSTADQWTTRDIAGAQTGTVGTESGQDAAILTITDPQLPLKGPVSGNGGGGQGARVVPTISSWKQPASVAARVVNAKDRSSAYSRTKDLTDEEQEQYRNELKARFSPLANNLPATIAGIAHLANQRIEDAIARGQFSNLPSRGKPMPVDHHAISPFIDTTEYIMNKMMKKQDIKHEWIEKQQEIDTATRRFRSRLRADWTRHAARVISSKGGSLAEQIQRAEAYASAEEAALKRIKAKNKEDENRCSQISRSSKLEGASKGIISDNEATNGVQLDQDFKYTVQISPFRDNNWEAAEKPYIELTIKSMNDMIRNYNLIAPQPSRKGSLNTKRELDACYAQSAPLIGAEMLRRAMQPKATYQVRSSTAATIPFLKSLDQNLAKIYDENIEAKGYGMREFWKDLWGKE